MNKTSMAIRKLGILAGVAVLATVATALPTDDAKITIDRALNSPTVTVRYSGANAAIVELRLNGESIGTRPVTANKTSGETNFTINLADLKDGDNEVEIRLFDRTGKLVGTEKTKIATDQTQYGPVFLSTPKVGESVKGSVEIKLGFGRELRNVYVSFFVDDNFKKMTNIPPYTYSWDTTGESNGWHEVEAWAVDESSNTYKTRKTRIFVNNPGGRTDRQGVKTGLKVSSNPQAASTAGSQAGIRNMNTTGAKAASAQLNGAAPKTTSVATNGKAGSVGSMSGFKSTQAGSIASGTKSIAPNGMRVATNAAVVTTQGGTLNHVASAANLVPITKGQRLPNLASFAVVLNSEFVDFDVNPRVDEGIPMTPFRHLIEKAGGSVDWANLTKTVTAKAEGKDIWLQIGDRNAKINSLTVSLETAPYIDRGRTIVPLSFISDALNVTIEYDKETGHVLITDKK
jgi:hypothetical protein